MGKLILVVDDKQRLDAVAKVAADRLGASVHAVTKVVLAKQFMIQKAPDLVLVDAVILDDPTAGFKFCKELRGHSTFAQIPVVIICESLIDTVVEEAKNVSAQGVLAWPVLPETLIKRIQPLLEFGLSGQPQAAVPPKVTPVTTPPKNTPGPGAVSTMAQKPTPTQQSPIGRPVPTTTPIPPAGSVSGSASVTGSAIDASSVQDVLSAFSSAIKTSVGQTVDKPAPGVTKQVQMPTAPQSSVPKSVGSKPPSQVPTRSSAVDSSSAEKEYSVEDKLKKAQQILASVLHNLKTSDLLQVVELEDIPGIVLQMTRKVCDPSLDSANKTLDDAFKPASSNSGAANPMAARTGVQNPGTGPQKSTSAANPAVELDLDSLFGLKNK